jgi:hypothetical protein
MNTYTTHTHTTNRKEEVEQDSELLVPEVGDRIRQRKVDCRRVQHIEVLQLLKPWKTLAQSLHEGRNERGRSLLAEGFVLFVQSEVLAEVRRGEADAVH